MSDKRITPEEDYLDSLLRSITSGGEEELDDNFIAEDMDFDSEVDDGMSEEEFLSDFEKEFFGADIDSDSSSADAGKLEKTNLFDEQEINVESMMFEEPEMVAPAEMPKEEKTVFQAEDTSDPEAPVVPEIFAEVMPEAEEPEVSVADMLFGNSSNTSVSEPVNEQVDESVNDAIQDFDLAEELMNVSDEQVMVEEAIANEDSSVEADLQGLYGILGMGNEEQELPADIEDAPKKKKGWFSKKDKKEKKEKKEKKKKDKKKKDLEEEVANTLVVEGEGIEDFDFSDISLDALGGGDSADANGALGNAFDESILDGMGDGAGAEDPFGGENPFGGEDPFGGVDPFGGEAPFDEEDEIDEEAELKAKKKQAKKEAKEKKKKEKEQKKKEKEKEKKKKAAKKQPKPKKVKEPDEVIKIPVAFIVLALSFIIIVILVSMIGGDYYHYNERFYKAVSLYVYGNSLEEGEVLDQERYEGKFNDAYNLICGLEMKEKDHQVFYDQLTTIMLMDRHYEAYKSHIYNDDYAHGLDSLVKAVKMYDKYQNEARELKCFDEMTVVLGWVENKLTVTYGISVSEARELSMIKDDDEYAVKVRTIAARAEAKKNINNNEE